MNLAKLIEKLTELQAAGAKDVRLTDGSGFYALAEAGVYHDEELACVVLDTTANDEE